MKGC
jgi:hypothetical protein